MEQKFTVFADQGGRQTFFNSHGSLEETIRFVTAFKGGNYTPVAWAAEVTFNYGGTKIWDDLRAESIAAGRLIECIDGKYIARTPGEVGFDFKNKKDPEQQTWQEQAARHAKACEVPALPATEKPRPALDWATVKQFDSFPGYRVTSDTGPMVDATDHPLQRLQLADPACGSAHIKKAGAAS